MKFKLCHHKYSNLILITIYYMYENLKEKLFFFKNFYAVLDFSLTNKELLTGIPSFQSRPQAPCVYSLPMPPFRPRQGTPVQGL